MIVVCFIHRINLSVDIEFKFSFSALYCILFTQNLKGVMLAIIGPIYEVHTQNVLLTPSYRLHSHIPW